MPNNPTAQPLFALGRVVATPAALEALEGSSELPLPYLTRYQYGDFGGLTSDDLRANLSAVANGERILSSYVLKSGTKLWIITDAADDDGLRQTTTILLPEDY